MLNIAIFTAYMCRLYFNILCIYYKIQQGYIYLDPCLILYILTQNVGHNTYMVYMCYSMLKYANIWRKVCIGIPYLAYFS